MKPTAVAVDSDDNVYVLYPGAGASDGGPLEGCGEGRAGRGAGEEQLRGEAAEELLQLRFAQGGGLHRSGQEPSPLLDRAQDFFRLVHRGLGGLDRLPLGRVHGHGAGEPLGKHECEDGDATAQKHDPEYEACREAPEASAGHAG